jgi:hypothetical protein
VSAAHTPGPWQLADYGWISGPSGDGVVEYDGCGSHAAQWPNKADLALVLAAPELLEACRLFLDAMRSIGASNGAIRKAEEAAAAAIRKATRP